MDTFTVVTTLIYKVTAETAEEATDVVAVKTNNPADMDGISFVSGNYFVVENDD